jgi:O-antigen/teichoic acid export membrane protein
VNTPHEATKAYRKELLKNQVWQVLNFGSKAGFLILLTPLMISKWGAEGYGLFALASSLLVSMAILDGGVRALTRIQMAEAWKRGEEETARRVYREGFLTFVVICLLAVAASGLLAATGHLTSALRLPEGGASVLVLTVACTAVLMISLLLLEPLAARGNLSAMKAANTWGAIVAIPLCGVLVFFSCHVATVVFSYAASLTIPNLVIAWRSDLFELAPWRRFSQFTPRIFWNTLRSGLWYYLTTLSLIGKTHALTFLVSAMAGPAEAGIFYLLLRLSEIVGNVGATASETSLAALAAAPGPEERRENFRQSWLHVALFCTQGALVFIFLIHHLLSLWLHHEELIPRHIGLTLAAFGLAGAFSRVVVNASMGLSLIRPAAIAGLWEAGGSICAAAAGFHFWGLPGLFLGGSLGIVALLPVSNRISERCGWKSFIQWFSFLLPLLPGFATSAVILCAASWSHCATVWILSLIPCGVILLLQLKVLHAQAPHKD